MLELKNVSASYGRIEVLHNINIKVKEGEIVTIIGANGAGKTTTLRTISGLLKPSRDSEITFMGKRIDRMGTDKIVAEGLALVPEGRRVFPKLTVLENLEMGAFLRKKDVEGVQRDLKHVYQLFPRLEERKKQRASTLSGGEQQMLAVARALMTRPKLMMLDEPSMGLAPLIVQEIFNIVKRINKEDGTTILLVEQNAKMALATADHGYVLRNGEITMYDTGEALLNNEQVRKAYLGEDVYKK